MHEKGFPKHHDVPKYTAQQTCFLISHAFVWIFKVHSLTLFTKFITTNEYLIL